MVVGRFENGTPVTLHGTPVVQPPPNDFNYSEDPNGERCPFRAHIRKTNPRGDLVRQRGIPEGAERDPIMARRGITYGKRILQSNGDFAEDDRPNGDVGLLFMAYMADISAQFEFTQETWVNNLDFVVDGNGLDPIIGQVASGVVVNEVSWKDGYKAGAAQHLFDFHGFVTLKEW